MGEHGYLQHARDWTMTRDAIVRLAARLGTSFTYGDLEREIEEHDGLKIDGRGYAGALEAVAVHLTTTDPLWTSMVVNAETGEPGDGFWRANPSDPRYLHASLLSAESRQAWLIEQRNWCIASAQVLLDPLDPRLRASEEQARNRARDCLIGLLRSDQGPT